MSLVLPDVSQLMGLYLEPVLPNVETADVAPKFTKTGDLATIVPSGPPDVARQATATNDQERAIIAGLRLDGRQAGVHEEISTIFFQV
ncbi:hypothetical protein [Microtetraspora sp. NBRC 16547]|uniref:hypothetical protein n=1 Tax=Microtetraspora sp. NBRC 16547 TaxID=3030993 RepID=UPI0025565252|nr:hypothetical protein [Microtetraspora sp. NBRC 16547]